jgi:predicted RND superfamily exporter protein
MRRRTLRKVTTRHARHRPRERVNTRAFFTVVTARPWLTIGCFALVFAFALERVRDLTIDFRPSAVFLDDDPDARAYEGLQARWGRDDLTLLVAATVDEGTWLTSSRVAHLARVRDTLRALPSVKRVAGLPDAPVPLLERTSAADNADAFSTPLVEDLAKSGRLDEESVRAAVLRAPGLVPALLAKDGRAAALIVDLALETDDIGPLVPLVTEIERALAPLAVDGVRLSTAGLPASRTAFMRLTLRDQTRLVSLALVVMGLLLALIFRSVHGVVVPAIAALSPLVLLMAAMAIAGEPVGLVNQVYFTLIPALAVADAIHIVHRAHDTRPGIADPRRALVEALVATGPACLLTSLTTAVGFFSLASSDIAILRRFGLFAAIGVTSAFVVVIVLVPALLTFVTKPASPRITDGGLERALTSLTRRLIAWPKVTLLIALVVTGVPLAVFVPRVVVDNELTGLVPDEEDAAFGNRILNTELGGILSIVVELTSTDGRDLARADVLAALDDISAHARSQTGVRAAFSAADVYGALTPVFLGHGGQPASDDELAALRLLAGEPGVLRSVQAGTRTRLVIGSVDDGARAVLARRDAIRAFALSRVASLHVDTLVTGRIVEVYEKLSGLVADLRTSLVYAVLAILVSLLVFFRSLRLFVACIPSNVLPIVCGYAALGALSWPLDLGPAVILTIAFGISVDDTIHIAERYRAERKNGVDVHDAIVAAVAHSGRAVVITSVVLIAGFALQMLSSFKGIFGIGLLGSLVVLTALLADLVVLPPLIMLLEGGRVPDRPHPPSSP